MDGALENGIDFNYLIRVEGKVYKLILYNFYTFFFENERYINNNLQITPLHMGIVT